jgi:hypothetical protein
MNEIFDLMHIGKGYTLQDINMMTIYERDMHFELLIQWLKEQKVNK